MKTGTKALRGGNGETETGLKDLKLPAKKKLDKGVLRGNLRAAKERLAELSRKAVASIRELVPEMKRRALELAELYLDYVQEELEDRKGPKEKQLLQREKELATVMTKEELVARAQAIGDYNEHATWIADKLSNPHVAVADAMSTALFQGLFSVELEGHKQLGYLCEWLVQQGQLAAAHEESGFDFKQYGKFYKTVADGQTRTRQLKIFYTTKDRVWQTVRAEWKRQFEEMPKTEGLIGLHDFLDRKTGTVFLIFPAKMETWKGKPVCVEGGIATLLTDGYDVCFVEVANDLTRLDGRPGWGSFEQYVNEFQALNKPSTPKYKQPIIPMTAILSSKNPGFPRDELGKRKFKPWGRIREAIYNMRVLAGEVKPKEKPLAKPAPPPAPITVPVPAAEPTPVVKAKRKPRANKTAQPKSAKEMAGVASVTLGPTEKPKAKKPRAKKTKAACVAK